MAEESENFTLVPRGKRLSSDEDFTAPPTTLPPSVQGYDYEFVPNLEPKFECPICLLCQRDPTQTTCGHRFCRDCILTWIRSEKSRCPEDNSDITEHDLFPDNFAKREIMSLTVRCPNSSRGCIELLELNRVQDHLQICEFELVPCPNNCGMKLMCNSIEAHVQQDCFLRRITCKLCHVDFLLKELEGHYMQCPMVTVPCEQCTQLLPRHKLQLHTEVECPRTKLPCPFHEIGCSERLEREEMDHHYETSMNGHLHLLTSAFQTFKFSVGNFLQKNEPSRSGVMKKIFSGDTSIRKTEENVNKSDCDVLQLNYEDGDNLLFTSNAPPGIEKVDDSYIEKKIPWMPSSPSNTIQDLFHRNVQLEQRSREQEIKMDMLRSKLEQREHEYERTVSELTKQLNAFETKFCNGVYIWRVNNFSRLQMESTRGHNRVLHSPGFYTSCFGYKVCLRLNIQGKTTMHVSLFIHLMQGEYDVTLTWPFVGKIVLTILDQDDRSETRADITETMLTKPGLTAFRRPVTERNPKGFGYTEFVSIDTLLSGPYIKNDQLIIKAVVSL